MTRIILLYTLCIMVFLQNLNSELEPSKEQTSRLDYLAVYFCLHCDAHDKQADGWMAAGIVMHKWMSAADGRVGVCIDLVTH